MNDSSLLRRAFGIIIVLLFVIQYLMSMVSRANERVSVLEENRRLRIQHIARVQQYCDIHEKLNGAYQKTLYTLMDYLGLWHRSRLTDYVQLPGTLGVGGSHDGETDEQWGF